MEWRYSLAAHKVIAIDVGHVCQNLYLACEAIGAGTCAVAAYDQDSAGPAAPTGRQGGVRHIPGAGGQGQAHLTRTVSVLICCFMGICMP